MVISSTFEPYVSIIIPVYNGSNYLREAISSALAQTYNNIEVIVVNDGSNDNGATKKIAKSFGKAIRYFEQENGGVASALNLGLTHMRGDYFSWLSHDDVYLPHKIKNQIQFLSSQTNKEVVLYSNYELINENAEHILNIAHDHAMLVSKPLYGLLRGCIHGCSMLIPKTAFTKVGNFDTSLRTTQDYALWFKMIRVVPFIHLPTILIKSRWHEAQDSKQNQYTLVETNDLWKMFMQDISLQEMLACEPSDYQFYKKLADFLRETPYTEATSYAEFMFTTIKNARLNTNFHDICVTVIIPFYNRISWTLEALLSVQAQTHTNLEILLIDNNSTDDISTLLQYIESDTRIKYHKQNRPGVSYSRNLGLDIATGEYICFLDSDDTWVNHKIENQLRDMIINDVVFSHTAYQTFTKEAHMTIFRHDNKDFSFPNIIKYCGIATPTIMIKKTIIDKHHFRFPCHFSVAEDVCLWITIAEKYSPYYFDLVTTYVRLHGKNAAYDKNKELYGLVNIVSFIQENFAFSQITSEFYYLLKLISIRIQDQTQTIELENRLLEAEDNNTAESHMTESPMGNEVQHTSRWLTLRSKIVRVMRYVYIRLPRPIRSIAKSSIRLCLIRTN